MECLFRVKPKVLSKRVYDVGGRSIHDDCLASALNMLLVEYSIRTQFGEKELSEDGLARGGGW